MTDMSASVEEVYPNYTAFIAARRLTAINDERMAFEAGFATGKHAANAEVARLKGALEPFALCYEREMPEDIVVVTAIPGKYYRIADEVLAPVSKVEAYD